MPARASFISGLYSHSHGIWHNRGELPREAESLFRRLQRGGYYTAHIGKSHYYPHGHFHMREREDYMRARGFDFVHETTGPWATVTTDSYLTDSWRPKGLVEVFRADYERRRRHREPAVWPSPLPVEEYPDSYVGRQAVRFIEGYDRREPFALFVGFGGPHEPWDAPGEYATLYDPAQTPAPIEPAEPREWVPAEAAAWQRQRHEPPLNPDDIARVRANYYGKIALIDRWFGEIIAACERKRLWDDVFVLFWSDHGEMAGDHGRLCKSCFFESALRVPLIVRWPGRTAAGAVSRALAQTVDILPTVLDAAGIEPPRSAGGLSLWPALRDPAAPLRDAALSEIEVGGRCQFMLCTDRWKYAVLDDGRGFLLHDLASDPEERNNLIGHPEAREVESALRERLLESLCETQYVM